jgi:hypothetical protein
MAPSVPAQGQVTFFCPACWERVAEATRVCPACGVDILLYLSVNDYGAQLIDTLQHPDAARRLLAAWILGERREHRAVPKLRTILLTEKRDVYMAKAAAVALARIGGVEAEEILHWARNCHPALVVRTAAARAFAGSSLSR